MLLITSLLGSILGFFICYQIIVQSHHFAVPVRMRACMINSMALAFLFSMLIELTTDSMILAIIIPLVTVCLPIVLMMKPISVLDVVEACTTTLMSVLMSVMLIGMLDYGVMWVIQLVLVLVEIILYLAIPRKSERKHSHS